MFGLADFCLGSITPDDVAKASIRDRAFVARSAVDCAASIHKMLQSPGDTPIQRAQAATTIKAAARAIASLSQRGDVADKPAIDAATDDNATG
jgi:hypothetical protein